MASVFKKGDVLRQIVPAPAEGPVVRVVFDEEAGDFTYVLDTPDGERVFHEKDVEAASA